MENDKPLQVLRPALWPDDKNLFYWILVVEIAVFLLGVIFNNPAAVFLSLVFMGILPGIALFFHALFHLLVKVQIFEDRLVITSFAGGHFINVAQQQELFLKDIAYVYYMEKEINFLKAFCRQFKSLKSLKTEANLTFGSISEKYKVTREQYDEALRKAGESFPGAGIDRGEFFLQTKLNLKDYLWTETRARGYFATARVRAYLVLSNREGSKKAYCAHFYDLSGEDSQRFLNIVKKKNPDINFLMNSNQVRRLFSASC